MPAHRPAVAVLLTERTQREVIDDAIRAELNAAFDARWPAAGETPILTGGGVEVERQERNALRAIAPRLLANADGCITGWNSPRVDAELLAVAPNLRILAHSAGSVKPFVSDELYARGAVVTSAAAENAVDVAHFTLAAMVFGCKNVMELSDPRTLDGNWGAKRGHRRPDDLRGAAVGIVGAGLIGRLVLKMLAAFDVRRLLCDPYVSAEQARALGAEKVELDDLFRRSDIVSLHAPSLPSTRHIVNAARLALLKDGATLINTARGSLVDEAALVAELQRKRIWAFVDVTDPEPPRRGSPLFSCPNLTLTPHLAGAIGRGRKRLGRCALEELQRFFAGQPVLYPVSQESLATSA